MKALKSATATLLALELAAAALPLLAATGCTTTMDMERLTAAAEEEAAFEDADGGEGRPPQDAEREVVYVEPPDVVYGEGGGAGAEEKALSGADALRQLLKDSTVTPEYAEGRLKAWVYRAERIYQVHTQTYHSTIVQLEPGEEMVEVPYISEPDVWRMSFGTGPKDGQATQYLIIKPDYSGLDSTLIVITNRRLYQLQLKSYKDHYMPYVKWVYNDGPRSMEAAGIGGSGAAQGPSGDAGMVRAANMSFDYTVTHAKGNKPVWCPTLVYDDGQRTFIVLDERCLSMEMPAVFKNSSEIVNSRVDRNVIILDGLIEKATLKLGQQKVTMTKKRRKD